ncbi:hypothetical protein V6615_00855 [Oscillospiraceae bacterium PP1C4]
MNVNTEKIKEVFSDKEFVAELLNCEEPEDVQKALDEKEISLSLDEVSELRKWFEKYSNGEIAEETLKKAVDSELSDEDLETVSGGSIIALIVASIITAAAIATAGGLSVGASVMVSKRVRW